jgi:hypothetical protein
MPVMMSTDSAMLGRAKRIGRSAKKLPPGKEPLQIRIPTLIKRRFKAHAAMRGLEPNALFVEVWELYEASLRHRPIEDAENRHENEA